MSSILLQDFIVKEHIKNALKEDIGFGDITTDFLINEDVRIKAELNTREDGILCGIDIFETVFKILSNEINVRKFYKDGDKIKKGETIAIIEGSARAILTGERTALNYIQRLSGIATETFKYQEAIGNNKARITKATDSILSCPNGCSLSACFLAILAPIITTIVDNTSDAL